MTVASALLLIATIPLVFRARATPAPGAQIDHILVSNAPHPRTARFLDLPDTDHRGLVVNWEPYAAR